MHRKQSRFPWSPGERHVSAITRHVSDHTDALHPPAPGPTPEEHRELLAEVQAMTTRADYLEQTIADLRADKEYLRGEIARVQQENSLLTHRLLPPPRAGGVVSRIRRWWSGSGEE